MTGLAYDAVSVEAGVEAAAAGVAHNRRVRCTLAGNDDLAVGLHRHRLGNVFAVAADVGGDLAIAVEACVEAAVGVEASQREVEAGAGARCTRRGGDCDLAV